MNRIGAAFMLLIALSTRANANGAMGLGLEIFDMGAWWVYVIVTILFEAWLIGRWLKLSWMKSVTGSVIANLVTAIVIPGLGAVFFHVWGPNPNPLSFVLKMLVGYGLASAVMEFVFWQFFADLQSGGWRVLGGVVVVHLLGVVVALPIVLAPEHPYPGIERTAGVQRGLALTRRLQRLDDVIMERGELPVFTNATDLVGALSDDPQDLLLVMVPDYSRFSTGGPSKELLRVNTALSGRKLNPSDREISWLIAKPNEGAWIIDLATGEIRWKFGFTVPSRDLKVR